MKKIIYKRIEYYLYNYNNINKMIETIEQDIIDNADTSVTAWLKSKNIDTNTVENQAIRIADNKQINTLKKVRKIIQHYLYVFKVKNPKRYQFIKLKYFDKLSTLEINKILGYNEKEQIDITNNVVSFFYGKFKEYGIGGM